MNKQTQIFNNLAKDLKTLEKQKENLSKEEYKRKFDITIHNNYMEYRKARKKTPYKKNHNKRKK